MKGHIQGRGDGRWLLKWDAPRGIDGKRRQRYKTFKGTKREAENALAKCIAETAGGLAIEPSKATLKECLNLWLTNAAQPRVSPKTFERYTEYCEKHLSPNLGAIKLAKLRPIDIQEYEATALKSGRLNGKGGLSARTVHHLHRVLFQALKQAVRWQMIIRNPCEAVDPPRPPRREVPHLTQEDLAILLKAARPSHFYPAILLAATTGLRRGEVLALRWSDVDLDGASLAVNLSLEETRKDGIRTKAPKTAKSRRTISLPAITVEELRRHKAQQGEERLKLGLGRSEDVPVFSDPAGEPIRPRDLTKQFGRIVKMSKVRRISFHGLRHTHLTHLLQAGIHPKIASERAGHSSVSITLDVYSHAVPGLQADAALKVDQALRAALKD